MGKTFNGPETLVFDSATSVAIDTQGVFQLVQVDLSPYNGQQVTLEWRFDTADGLITTTSVGMATCWGVFWMISLWSPLVF